MLRSLRKVLALRQTGGADPSTALWIIAGGRPAQVFSALPSLRPDPHWYAGVYGSDPGLGLWVMVTSELPSTPDTLLFRLVGAGRTLRQAFREVRQLPGADPLRRWALPFMIELHLEVRERAHVEPELQEFVMETQSLYEIWQAKLLAQGEARAKVADLLAVLSTRGVSLTPEETERVRTTSDLTLLDAWIVRAVTASTSADVFG